MADQRQAGSLWTPEEDVLLLRHVAKYGTKHWGYLQTSGILPHRDQKACCNRFILLKRKFFQARAKGQRLTFPVVPQPEPPVVKRSSSPSTSSGRQSSPPRLLQAVPSTSFKRSSGCSSPSASSVRKAFELTRENRTSSLLSELDNFTSSYNPEQAAILQRTMEGLPEKPIVREDSGISSVQDTSGSFPVLPKAELYDNSIKEFQSQQQQQVPQAVYNKTPLNLASLSNNSLQAAVWRCFNPDDVSTLLSEVSDQTFPTVPDIAQVGAANGGFLAPDAMLEQMSSVPMKTLFGHSSITAAAENLLDAYACAESAQWNQQGPQNTGFDLWDLMRASATA